MSGGRLQGRCVTADGSATVFSRTHRGPARAESGTAAATVSQQNNAQRGRQNNICGDLNNTAIDVTGGGIETQCADVDESLTEHSAFRGSGAGATGGNGVTGAGQQNIAQVGRQNNACADASSSFSPEIEAAQLTERCVNHDASVTKHTRAKSGGARAEGGSAATFGALQQNIAQEGRQNNACADASVSTPGPLTGARVTHQCGNRDASVSKHVLAKNDGALAESGSAGLTADHQDIAQEGRQNNACADPNNSGDLEVTAGRTTDVCDNRDASLSKHTVDRVGGARAEGGSAGTTFSFQENVAQEGRQNNACTDLNSTGDVVVTGGRTADRCGNLDASVSKHTVHTSRGAHAEGGSTTGIFDTQENIAQEGRQNNACANDNSAGNVEFTSSRTAELCGNRDASLSKHTVYKTGGAHVEGGSATGINSQQNTAQEGRQNNACGYLNRTQLALEGATAEERCLNTDLSVNKHTKEKNRGAHVEGGDALGRLTQQNIAQEGRQNNACGNANDLTLTATGARTRSECVAGDRSVNIGTQES
ncbi:hypothetical protein [Streptomyces anandii]|uniref:hypothetical protein n=1 Tax=Streptomyces anandii TaxID=285454 RepID=UPI001E48D4C4|nr:hypothetical protein [Streptomyces anandii]